MARTSKALTYANESYELSRNVAELQKQVQEMTKLANRRLAEIEVVSHTEGFRNIRKHAYAKAMYEIARLNEMSTESKGRPLSGKRFSANVDTSKPGAYAQLMARANALRGFLNSKSSLKTGIQNTYQKRVETFNKKYGTDFTWETFAVFMENGGADSLKNYDSNTVLKVIAKIQKNDDDKVKKISDYNDRIKFVADGIEEETITNALLKDGIDFNTLKEK